MFSPPPALTPSLPRSVQGSIQERKDLVLQGSAPPMVAYSTWQQPRQTLPVPAQPVVAVAPQGFALAPAQMGPAEIAQVGFDPNSVFGV